jgi:hypothetical protein
MNASIPGTGSIISQDLPLLERLENILKNDQARAALSGFDITVLRMAIDCIRDGELIFREEQALPKMELRLLGHLSNMMERPMVWSFRKTLSDAYDALKLRAPKI